MHINSSMRLWQLISPTLPIGAYSWSTGIEYAVEVGWIKDEASASEWILGQIKNSLPAIDVAVFYRLYEAWYDNNDTKILYWNDVLLAMRESAELRNEDTGLGNALIRVFPNLDIHIPDIQIEDWSYAAAFSWACYQCGLNKEESAQGMLWSWCENQVAAAIKLVPLGQSSGQRLLSSAIPIIAVAAEQATKYTDDEIGLLTPGLAIASARHETQYSRLFRS
ncbi:MAG TPA: urease accessory UreF family protein [Gammaproteobacteria bacterium]